MEKQIIDYLEKNELDNLAKYLLFNVHLLINGKGYRMAEIELYICHDKHKDIFTHCHSNQKKMMTWYFHQMSEKEHSYKGGTFKGLDISCGINNGHGGVLIRSLLNEETGDVIEGPCNVVNEILSKTKADTVKDLVDKMKDTDIKCINNGNLLKLELKKYKSEDVYIAPRIGLTLKGSNPDEKKNWIDKKYRYVIFKDKIKKEKKKMEKL